QAYARAGAIPHAVAMAVLPFYTVLTEPRGRAMDGAVVLIALVLFLVHLFFHMRRQVLGARDIEAALREARRAAQLSRILFAQAPGAATLLDAELRYVAVSRSFCTLFKVDERDAIGQPFEEVVTWMSQQMRDAHRQALAGHGVKFIEDKVVWPDGKISYSNIEFAPWRDEAGAICGVIVFGTDVTAYVRAREEKDIAATRLAVALHNTNAAVWEIDFARERLMGEDSLVRIYQRAPSFEDVRRLSADFVAPEDRDATRKALVDIAAGGGRGSVRARFRRADGKERWAEHLVEIFRAPDQSITRMVLLTSDITHRRRIEIGFEAAIRRMEEVLSSTRASVAQATGGLPARRAPFVPAQEGRRSFRDAQEAEAARFGQRVIDLFDEMVLRNQALMNAVEATEAASAAKSTFLASMSHELRTPLNAILGYAEILDEDLTAAKMEGPAADARRVRAAARHLLHLINEILDLSKIEAGRMDVEAGPFDVEAMTREAIETIAPLVGANSNTLTVSLAPDLGQAHTDSVKLNQCLLNLLSNACKF
ncbi:MAG TPA: histidine kinase dimerization/phospho-acceptor domain-containing protein, partial [Caulobacterales bacterium]|nr:histidine kinase dimerization/phospho-acceptor domain-containing protein [Caulobacterales bacterium]